MNAADKKNITVYAMPIWAYILSNRGFTLLSSELHERLRYCLMRCTVSRNICQGATSGVAMINAELLGMSSSEVYHHG